MELITAACARVNQAALAPAPVTPPATVAWAGPGVQVVHGHDHPLYLVDDAYWMLRDGEWMTWGGIGWRGAAPPTGLAEVPTRPHRWHWDEAASGLTPTR